MTTFLPEASTDRTALHRDFLTLASLGPDGLRAMLDMTARLKREPGPFEGALAGHRIGMIFDKPITRVRYDLLPLEPEALDQALEPILGMVRAPVVAGG
jgi:hypothetical protein